MEFGQANTIGCTMCVVDCKWNGMERMEYTYNFMFEYPEFISFNVYDSNYWIRFFIFAECD